jgi:predicted metal-dependent hydrolase
MIFSLIKLLFYSKVKSNIDQRYYYVLGTGADSTKKADKLARLKIKIDKLQLGIDNIIISEAHPFFSRYGYAVNGEIFINLNIADHDLLFNIVLHELSHIITGFINHNIVFWDTYNQLYNKAIRMGFIKINNQ